MRNDKLFFSFFPLALVFSLFFLGCSPSRSVGKPCEVSFSWWGNESRNQYTIEGIKLFEKENPSVKVLPIHESWEEYEKNFEKKLLSGNCADVMQVNFDWLHKYSGDGLGFYDMGSLDEYIDLYNFTMDDLSFGTMKGRLNAIPISFNTAIPVYDKKVLDELALDIPSTWDELFNLAKMLKKKDMCVFTLSNWPSHGLSRLTPKKFSRSRAGLIFLWRKSGLFLILLRGSRVRMWFILPARESGLPPLGKERSSERFCGAAKALLSLPKPRPWAETAFLGIS